MVDLAGAGEVVVDAIQAHVAHALVRRLNFVTEVMDDGEPRIDMIADPGIKMFAVNRQQGAGGAGPGSDVMFVAGNRRPQADNLSWADCAQGDLIQGFGSDRQADLTGAQDEDAGWVLAFAEQDRTRGANQGLLKAQKVAQ